MTNVQFIVTAVSCEDTLIADHGVLYPKNLAPYKNSTVLSHIVGEYSNLSPNISVVLSKNEIERFQTDRILKDSFPDLRVVSAEGTAGALCSALLGLDYSKINTPLIIAPGDSFTQSETEAALNFFTQQNVEAGTIVFESNDSRYSFVRVNSANQITEIAEKRVISNLATTGLFYFRNLPTLLEGAGWALVNSRTHNNQYFVSHSFHRLISRGAKTSIFQLRESHNYKFFKENNPSRNNLEDK